MRNCKTFQSEPICGIILKSKSPSCGLGSTKYYSNQMSEGKKDGLFALTCKEYFHDFPIEEEARLLDPWLRENFVMHLFAYEEARQFEKRVRQSLRTPSPFTPTINFSTLESEKLYRELGRIVANHELLPFLKCVKRICVVSKSHCLKG